jgi:hypothetical protein
MLGVVVDLWAASVAVDPAGLQVAEGGPMRLSM